MGDSGLTLLLIPRHFIVSENCRQRDTTNIGPRYINQSKRIVDIRLQYLLQPGFNNKQMSIYTVDKVTNYKILLHIRTYYRSSGIW